LDKVLIGRYWGSAAIGLYGRAYQLINIPTSNLNSAAGEVAFSALSRLQNDRVLRRRYFLKGFSLVLALTLPLTIGCEFFARDVVRVLLGAKWMEAVPVFRWLAPTILVFAIANPLSWLLTSSGQVERLMKMSLVIAAHSAARLRDRRAIRPYWCSLRLRHGNGRMALSADRMGYAWNRNLHCRCTPNCLATSGCELYWWPASLWHRIIGSRLLFPRCASQPGMLRPISGVHRLTDVWLGAKDALSWTAARDYRFTYIQRKTPRVSLRLRSGGCVRRGLNGE